jgi:hypothetical protein
LSGAPFSSSRRPITGNVSIDRTASGASLATVAAELVIDGPASTTTAATIPTSAPSTIVVPAARGTFHDRCIAEIGRSMPAATNPPTANHTISDCAATAISTRATAPVIANAAVTIVRPDSRRRTYLCSPCGSLTTCSVSARSVSASGSVRSSGSSIRSVTAAAR